MNKTACTAYAARCRAAAAKATDRAALYAVNFGSKDDVTVRELAEVARANDAASEWDKLAAMHPQSRAKLFRDGSLPSSIFGFSDEAEPAPAPAPAPAAQKTVKVVHTMYGYKGYVGAVRAKEFGSDSETFDATQWLSEMLATGEYALSAKSTITMQDIEKHRERMGQ